VTASTNSNPQAPETKLGHASPFGDRTPPLGASATDTALEAINAALAPIEEAWIEGFTMPRYPVTFVFGCPRSGHTLLSQVLAASGGFSYITNFMARLWMAPYLGGLLERSLELHDGQDGGKASEFRSEYGRTFDWRGPHEAGNFIRRWLPFGETHRSHVHRLAPDRAASLLRELAAIEALRERPVFIRNIVLGLNLAALEAAIPNAIFVVCERNPIYEAQSILLARERAAGDRERWWSLRPPNVRDLVALPYHDQIAAQVVITTRLIERDLAAVPSTRVVRVPYEASCHRPREVLASIAATVRGAGGRIDVDPDRVPATFPSRDVQTIPDADFAELEAAIARMSQQLEPVE
jgi:hypothetical protein